jgi:hypothetical protein
VIHFRIEQLHRNRRPVLFTERHQALQSGRAIFQALLVVHTITIAGETNDVLETSFDALLDERLIDFDKGVMMFDAIETVRNRPDLFLLSTDFNFLRRIADHRTMHIVLLHGRKILGIEQLDRLQSKFLARGNEIFERNFLVAPLAG